MRDEEDTFGGFIGRYSDHAGEHDRVAVLVR